MREKRRSLDIGRAGEIGTYLRALDVGAGGPGFGLAHKVDLFKELFAKFANFANNFRDICTRANRGHFMVVLLRPVIV